MSIKTFSNFDLRIEQVGKKYRSRVVASPAGEASGEFNKPLSTSDLDDFVLKMGRPQQGARQADSAEFKAIKQFGELLFNTVFTKDVYACYLRSLDLATKEGKGLRIRLRIDVPEFHDLPGEYLYTSQLNDFPALSTDTPIIRYFDLPYTTSVLSVEPPLKILVMISSPEGYPKLDIESQWRSLKNALQPLIQRKLVSVERIKRPTLKELQQRLRRENVHIFHFIGHGKYLEQKQDGKLLLEDENGKGKPVSGELLGELLGGRLSSLRVVVLNACEGSRTSAEDPYSGVAQTLVRKGIPAVIAMQFEIFEDAANAFAQEFYEAIADGYPVDAALSEARKAIYATGNEREWGTPVLFTRSPDNVLFKPTSAHMKKSDGEARELERDNPMKIRQQPDIAIRGTNVIGTINADGNSNINISQNVTRQVNVGSKLEILFQEVAEHIKVRPENPDVDKSEIQNQINLIQKESAKGNQANVNKLERWLRSLVDMAPDILDVMATSLGTPVSGFTAVFKKIVEKVKAERGVA